MTDSDPITHVPPPWVLNGTNYCFLYWIPASQAKTAFPAAIAYSPLERSSPFATGVASGGPQGGLASVMVLRYTDESPVGAYDEIIFSTGSHSYLREEEGGGGRRVEKKNLRITRIYVSQRQTCWNGRKDWNCPKHLARFEFTDLGGGSTKIKVFPHDTSGDPTDALPSAEPFFRATYRPVPLVPRLPLTTSLARYVGVDLTVVQPPVPEGRGSRGELAGSERWCSFLPSMVTKRAEVGWFDLRQYEGAERDSEPRNFWPGLGRWHLGVKMEDTDITFGNMVWWDAPRSAE